MITPSVVGVFSLDGAACIDYGSNVALNILFVVIGISVVGEAYYTACAVEVFYGACGAGFGENFGAIKSISDIILACSYALGVVGKCVIAEAIQLAELAPSQIMSSICGSVAEYPTAFIISW